MQMKTFQEFVAEAYDASVMSSSQIRKTGEGGRIGAERKKTAPERRRMKAVGGGKMEPAKEYKARKDIGTQRSTSTRVQQPEKERGAADVKAKAAAAAKEERKKAALARIAAKKKGETAPATKPKAKEAAKTASQLLAKKKNETVSPDYKPQTASAYTRAERHKLMRAGESELEQRVKEAEAEKQGKKPSEVKLKNFKKSWS